MQVILKSLLQCLLYSFEPSETESDGSSESSSTSSDDDLNRLTDLSW